MITKWAKLTRLRARRPLGVFTREQQQNANFHTTKKRRSAPRGVRSVTMRPYRQDCCAEDHRFWNSFESSLEGEARGRWRPVHVFSSPLHCFGQTAHAEAGEDMPHAPPPPHYKRAHAHGPLEGAPARVHLLFFSLSLSFFFCFSSNRKYAL